MGYSDQVAAPLAEAVPPPGGAAVQRRYSDHVAASLAAVDEALVNVDLVVALVEHIVRTAGGTVGKAGKAGKEGSGAVLVFAPGEEAGVRVVLRVGLYCGWVLRHRLPCPALPCAASAPPRPAPPRPAPPRPAQHLPAAAASKQAWPRPGLSWRRHTHTHGSLPTRTHKHSMRALPMM
jgi:hypothetical protein